MTYWVPQCFVSTGYVTSVAYTTTLDWVAVLVGTLLLVGGTVGMVLHPMVGIILLVLGLAAIAYAFLRPQQQLVVRTATEEATLELPVSRGEQIDGFLYAMNARLQLTSA